MKKPIETPAGRALTATEIVVKLADFPGWSLHGDGAQLAIEKSFAFDSYYQTLAFVNALAFIAHGQDHHPELLVHYGRCVVRWNTHDVGGISARDFDCARRVDALLQELP